MVEVGLAIDDEDEAAELDAWMAQRAATGGVVRDGRICLCGHGVGRHSVLAVGDGAPDRIRCQVGRNSVCPCASVVPVIEVRDTRVFLAATTGPGSGHALFKGMKLLAAKYPDEDVTPRELVSFTCGRCGSSDGIVPIPVDRRGMISFKAEKVTGLCCKKCLEDLPRAYKP